MIRIRELSAKGVEYARFYERFDRMRARVNPDSVHEHDETYNALHLYFEHTWRSVKFPKGGSVELSLVD